MEGPLKLKARALSSSLEKEARCDDTRLKSFHFLRRLKKKLLGARPPNSSPSGPASPTLLNNRTGPQSLCSTSFDEDSVSTFVGRDGGRPPGHGPALPPGQRLRHAQSGPLYDTSSGVYSPASVSQLPSVENSPPTDAGIKRQARAQSAASVPTVTALPVSPLGRGQAQQLGISLQQHLGINVRPKGSHLRAGSTSRIPVLLPSPTTATQTDGARNLPKQDASQCSPRPQALSMAGVPPSSSRGPLAAVKYMATSLSRRNRVLSAGNLTAMDEGEEEPVTVVPPATCTTIPTYCGSDEDEPPTLRTEVTSQVLNAPHSNTSASACTSSPAAADAAVVGAYKVQPKEQQAAKQKEQQPATTKLRPYTAPAPQLLPLSPPAVPPAIAGAKVLLQHSRRPQEESQLLCTYRDLPPTMQREEWSLHDYNAATRLYKGSCSAAYKATCLQSGLPVVLKVYGLEHVPSNVLHTLVREIRIHSQLQHQSIIGLYGVFMEKSRLVLVQERAHRGDLYRVHREQLGSRMTQAQLAVVVLAPLLDALAYIHSKGVCHRDIKPENLLVCADWDLKLADFGAAINLAEERAVTRTGTEDYMAPEVTRCPLKALPEENKGDASLAYTTAADIWSVGVLAFEMLVGFPPFSSANPYRADARASEAPLDNHVSFPGFVSPGARDFISSALAQRPGDRPTAAQLLRHPWLKGELDAYKVKAATHAA